MKWKITRLVHRKNFRYAQRILWYYANSKYEGKNNSLAVGIIGKNQRGGGMEEISDYKAVRRLRTI